MTLDNAVVLVENKLVIKQDFSEQLAEVVRAKKELDKKEKELKEILEGAIRTVVPNDQSFTFENDLVSINLGADTYVESFDTKNFKKKHEDLYNDFIKLSPRKGALRITCKD